MGNNLSQPILGAITTRTPFVITTQLAGTESSESTVAVKDNSKAYYAIATLAVLYFAYRLRGQK